MTFYPDLDFFKNNFKKRNKHKPGRGGKLVTLKIEFGVLLFL